MKARRGTFGALMRDGTKLPIDGWIMGDFAARKEGYFWEITHVPSGYRLSTYPCLEKKADAIAELERRNREGLTDFEKRAIGS